MKSIIVGSNIEVQTLYFFLVALTASLQSVGFVDSDYANDQNTRRSIDGYFFTLEKIQFYGQQRDRRQWQYQ